MPPYRELIAIHDRFFAETWGGDPEMVDSELVAAYRLNAANCTEVARHFEDVEHKIALLDMAQAWLRLAEITEKVRRSPAERPRASDHAQWLGAIIASSPRSPGLPVWSNRGRDGFFGAS
jgi:hypothetical protein